MSTIIVFSKDRPMQLHAYLESLVRASGCQQRQVYVLYREVLPVRYDKVKTYFPDVHWVPEDEFDSQLRKVVSEADEHIMFGCDDVVFINEFDLQMMERYLDGHEDIFAFSLRLGQNIKPLPKGLQKDGDVFSWSWEDNASHYGYPWELDCTLYRKRDVLGILQKIGKVQSPNYFESIPEENPRKYITTKRMAAYYERSNAIVITVNRVQDTHPNGIDDSGATDVLSLFIQYHYEDRYLDIDRLWKCKSDKVHVGNEYFILTSSVVSDLHAEENKGLGKWRHFIHNLRFLAAGNLEDIMRRQVQDAVIADRLQSMTDADKRPVMLGPGETVCRLAKQPESFCRFGDGEFTLMLGGSIGFQKYDPKLALALWEIFCEPEDHMYIGVPYQQFEMPYVFNNCVREFYFTSGSWVRKFLNRYLPNNREIYIDTGFNQVYQTYRNMNFFDYYEQLKKLFKDKKITVISGEGILDQLNADVFEFAADAEYIPGPKTNAFDVYEQVLDRALKIDKDRLICVILGPCSKVLVRDLTKAGYMAWDIGHLTKDYDSYMKRAGRNREDIARFYAPD